MLKPYVLAMLAGVALMRWEPAADDERQIYFQLHKQVVSVVVNQCKEVLIEQ